MPPILSHLNRRCCSAIFVACVVSGTLIAEDWRRWRGPTLDNHAPNSAVDAVPLTWSESENLLWRQPVPGQGHATPIVVDDAIFVLTHEPAAGTISLLKYRLGDGSPIGKVALHQGVVPPRYLHKKNTCASSTPSSDGNTVFVVAEVNQAIVATAISTAGKILWQTPVAPYRAGKGWFGFGSSLLLLDDSIVIAVDVDNDDRGLFCLSKKTGKQIWKAPRPVTASYGTPILAKLNGTPQILMSGGYQVTSYQPKTGRPLWSVDATSRTTCATMVWSNDMVFVSGSYPDPGTYGISLAGKSAKVAWDNKVKCYEQSMLMVGDYLYGIADNGVAYCWRSADGQEMWKQRLQGPFSASPLLIGDRIYASNERGKTYVYRASPDAFDLLSENKLGDSSFASPIYAGGKLILRHATTGGNQRTEFLVGIGK
ncbi:PQQ-binding-like beta-propeller repeat protein [Planctomycetes bacterium K23_9]|uniref:Outer membrane biogenesis protein BamB n=1 Tax=Stieleria marina TaxID=1930275 RepID=A0A517NTJ6_9BACT|nr:outer membrane biogenesis protein BamB [Planctomycetes bacterium K23_9]